MLTIQLAVVRFGFPGGTHAVIFHYRLVWLWPIKPWNTSCYDIQKIKFCTTHVERGCWNNKSQWTDINPSYDRFDLNCFRRKLTFVVLTICRQRIKIWWKRSWIPIPTTDCCDVHIHWGCWNKNIQWNNIIPSYDDFDLRNFCTNLNFIVQTIRRHGPK